MANTQPRSPRGGAVFRCKPIQHRADNRHQQEHGSQFEGREIAREEQIGQSFRVARRRVSQAETAAGSSPAEQSVPPPGREPPAARSATPCETADVRRRVQVYQHDHEQKQQRDSADVNHNLRHKQKLRAQQQKQIPPRQAAKP